MLHLHIHRLSTWLKNTQVAHSRQQMIVGQMLNLYLHTIRDINKCKSSPNGRASGAIRLSTQSSWFFCLYNHFGLHAMISSVGQHFITTALRIGWNHDSHLVKNSMQPIVTLYFIDAVNIIEIITLFRDFRHKCPMLSAFCLFWTAGIE